MLRLFKGGGKCIWVAPSGGRDRPNSDGVYTPAQFDPKSVEMFRLMSAKAADKTTHFYPVAMMTHRLFPPPKTLTPGALGEPRRAIRGSVNIAIGEPIDFDEVTRAGCLVDDFPPGCVEDREDAAQVAAEYAHLDQKAVAALQALPALQSTQILLELRRKRGAIRNPSAYDAVWKSTSESGALH